MITSRIFELRELMPTTGLHVSVHNQSTIPRSIEGID